MRIDVLTLFPDMFTAVFGSSILKQAAEKGSFLFKQLTFVCILQTNMEK